MKAEIEVGRNPRAFWLAVAAMASEHAGYYARENGFRANVAMFRAMVDAHNAGVSQLAIQHTLTGASAAVRAAIEDEGDLAPLSLATFGVVTTPVTGGCYGADWALDSRGMECTWTTSGGNSLTCRLEGEWFTLIAEGRRHGIPWRFLQDTGIQESDLLVTALESESSAKPWCDGQGQPLASLNGKLPDLSAVPIAPEPGVWPDWGNYHQQAGWVANKVCDTETFANFAMTCAKFAVPSTAVRYNCGRSLGVFRLASPAWQINWMGSKPLWTAWLLAHPARAQYR